MSNLNLIDELIKLHSQKLSYYRKLLNLSRRQKKIINSEEFKQLNQILDQKEKIIEDINQLDIEFQPYKKQIINKFNLDEKYWLSELVEKKQNNCQLKEMVDQLEKILQQLSKLNEENQNLLQSKKEKLNSELKDIKQGTQISKSYGGYQNKRIHSTYVDEKS